jgi:hypothetical protein
LKLCRHLEISATAAHFSMAAMREAILERRTISETTNCETWKKFQKLFGFQNSYKWNGI